MTLKEFLIERKGRLLDMEKRAIGRAQDAILGQLQMCDAVLIFLASKQTEEDMAKLKLTLEKHATPIDDIKPRQENEELAEGLIDLAEVLDQEFQALPPDEKAPIKFPLNNLPEGTKPSSVSAKIWAMRSTGKLPKFIAPKLRTQKDEDGKVIGEMVYMVRLTDKEIERIEQKSKKIRGE